MVVYIERVAVDVGERYRNGSFRQTISLKHSVIELNCTA